MRGLKQLIKHTRKPIKASLTKGNPDEGIETIVSRVKIIDCLRLDQRKSR